MMPATNLNKVEVIDNLHRLEPQLRQMGVTRLAIFGSRAREDHHVDSDLDVLIDVEPGRKFSLLDLVGVANAIEDSMKIEANVFMRRSLAPQMTASIRQDVVEVFS